MNPRAVSVSDLACGTEIVTRPGVHVSRLKAHDRRRLDAGIERSAQRVDVHGTVGVGLHRFDSRDAKPEKPEGAIDRSVAFLACDDPNRRCTDETVSFNVPPNSSEHAVPTGRKAYGIGALRPVTNPKDACEGSPNALFSHSPTTSSTMAAAGDVVALKAT